jgi:protocatechuate 3,4-dioxygenase beta subunit
VTRVLLVVAVAGALLAGSGAAGAAGSDPGACPTYNAPNSLVLDGGTPQSSRLGTPFASQLAVTVANTNGCPLTTPLAGIAVTFSAPTSGPSGTFASSGSNAVLLGTNGQGSAMAPMFTANSLPGGYLVTATSDYGAVSFSLVNTASGVSAAISAVGGSHQSTGVGARYGAPLQAVVTDATGAPVGGATVTFSFGQGASGQGGAGDGGSAGGTFLGGATQATAITDASGIARSPGLTANTVAGRFTASASTPGVVQPALFSLDNTAGKGLFLRLHGARRQSATAGKGYRRPLEAVVSNAAGRPVQGTTVTFSLGSADGAGGSSQGGAPTAGASFVGGASQATAVTDAHGLAVSPLFNADSTAGRFTATASVTGVMRPIAYALRNLPARTSSIAVFRDPPASATVDSRFANRLRVRILDGGGRPVAGATVTFALGAGEGGSSSGSGSAGAGATFAGGSAQATALTGTDGVALSPALTANGVAGSYAATASSTAAPGTVVFPLRNAPAAVTTITAGAATGETATVGSAFPVRPAVTVTDAKGNPVGGAVVVFAAPSHGASGRFSGHGRTVAVSTDEHGIAVAPVLVANRTAGGFVVRASVAGARPAAFALVNVPRG